MEIIDRVKLLINYDNRKTLTENVQSINEDAITQGVRQGTIVAKDLEGVLKTMKADTQVAKELETLRAGGVQTKEDLLAIVSANKLSAEAKAFMNMSILKSNTTNVKMLELAAQDLVKSPQFAQKYYKSWVEGGGRPGLEKALKDSGKYSEGAITQIVSQTEKNIANVEKMSKVKLKQPKKPKTTNSGKPKDITPTAPKPTIDPSVFTKIREYIKKFPKPSWKKIVAWGAGVGISALALWWFFHDEDVPVPDDIPETEPNPDTGGGGGGVGSRYSECSSFPYNLYCKSDDIAKVQECLVKDNPGLRADRALGPNTKAAIEKAGYSVPLTKEDFDKIMSKCGKPNVDNVEETDPFAGEQSLEIETGETEGTPNQSTAPTPEPPAEG